MDRREFLPAVLTFLISMIAGCSGGSSAVNPEPQPEPEFPEEPEPEPQPDSPERPEDQEPPERPDLDPQPEPEFPEEPEPEPQPEPEPDNRITISVLISGQGQTVLSLPLGSTVINLLEQEFGYEDTGVYTPTTIAGRTGFFKYLVNGVEPEIHASQYVLEDGDEIAIIWFSD